jgi:hypothetical protein
MAGATDLIADRAGSCGRIANEPRRQANHKKGNSQMTNPTTTIFGYDPGSVSDVGSGTFTVNLFDATIAGGVSLAEVGTLATIDINAYGVNTFNLTLESEYYDAGAVVDLASNSIWIGSFAPERAGFITVDGGHNSAFVNNGASNVFGLDVTINTTIAGTGSFQLSRDRGATGELTLNGAVGPGQTVILDTGDDGVATLNDPKAFAGLLDFQSYSNSAGTDAGGSGDINVNGLRGTADTYSFKNDMLAIYNTHGQVIDTLRLETADAFSVESTATGVSIYTAGDVNHPAGVLLAMHT